MKRTTALTLNKAAGAPQAKELVHFSSNVSESLIRNDTMEGREYTVVPMVMIVEGVLNGSNGSLYYPADELKTLPVTWNHKPVVVYHPEINGQGVSACDPEVCTTYKIGLIMNTKFEDGKLKAEAWIENERAKAVDNRVWEAIENNQMMELSTGLFIELEHTAGEFDGKAYEAIARNYKPDHLAVLPDKTGACSVEAGAGFIRNSLKDTGVSEYMIQGAERKVLGLCGNEMSHGDIRDRLYGILEETFPYTVEKGSGAWIVDVWDESFVYERGADMYLQKYTEVEGTVSLEGEPVKVFRSQIYKTADGAIVGNDVSHNNNQNQDMKDKLIQALIANGVFETEDKEWLEGKSEAYLQGKLQAFNEGVKASEKVKELEANAAASDKEGKGEVSAEQYISNAPAGVREVLQESMRAHNEEKARIIKTITSNSRNVFSEESLKTKDLQELKAIEALATVPTSNQTPRFDLQGGEGALSNNATEEAPETVALFATSD